VRVNGKNWVPSPHFGAHTSTAVLSVCSFTFGLGKVLSFSRKAFDENFQIREHL
jgi:hypothetical protein